jgi:pyruvate ferredoxin oxidoreductase alpha subunit
MVTTDGFIISHCLERIETLEDAEVKNFIADYQPKVSLLDVEHPVTFGSLDLQDYYFEHRRQMAEAINQAPPVILAVADAFNQKYGRKYGFFEGYRLADAEIAVVALGSTCGTARVVVDELRAKGVAAGMLKLRVFRPFMGKELAEALANTKAVAVLDRSEALSTQGGQLFSEVKAALYALEKRPKVINYIYGLGGRDVNLDHLRSVFSDLQSIDGKPAINYLGLRE